MYFGSTFSLFIIAVVAVVGVLFAATQPGGVAGFVRGSAQRFVIRGVFTLIVFGAINLYLRVHHGL